jgi:hypothetical protein
MDFRSTPLRATMAVIGAAVALGTVLTASAASANTHTQPRHTPAVSTASNCPAGARGILPLQPNGVQRAADRALAEAARLYPDLNTKGAEVMFSARSQFAGARGSEVRHLCGKTVAARTVVVQMLFPRMLPSASLSQADVFAGRFGNGYRVWYIAH